MIIIALSLSICHRVFQHTNDWQQFTHMFGQQMVKECFISIFQRVQIEILIDRRLFPVETLHNTFRLHVQRHHARRHQSTQTQTISLLHREPRAFVVQRIVYNISSFCMRTYKQRRAILAVPCHCTPLTLSHQHCHHFEKKKSLKKKINFFCNRMSLLQRAQMMRNVMTARSTALREGGARQVGGAGPEHGSARRFLGKGLYDMTNQHFVIVFAIAISLFGVGSVAIVPPIREALGMSSRDNFEYDP
jgi:hypothetical protein